MTRRRLCGRKCNVCLDETAGKGNFCVPCGRSYDRATAQDDGTIQAALDWAARRARAFERRRQSGLQGAYKRAYLHALDLLASGAHPRIVRDAMALTLTNELLSWIRK